MLPLKDSFLPSRKLVCTSLSDRSKWQIAALVISIPVAAIAGYGLMRLMPEAFTSFAEGSTSHYLVSLVIILLGIGVPLWMLKAGLSAAHKIDPREKELKVSDIPKDKEDLSKT